MGIGEAHKTAEAYLDACDLFVYTENLSGASNENTDKQSKIKPAKTTKQTEKQADKTDLPINKITNAPIDINNILKAFDMVVNDNSLAYMGEMGTALRKLDPSFDCKTYGSATMTNLLKDYQTYLSVFTITTIHPRYI